MFGRDEITEARIGRELKLPRSHPKDVFLLLFGALDPWEGKWWQGGVKTIENLLKIY